MAKELNYNLLEDETRECPFKYFKSIRDLENPVYFMPELQAFYVSKYQDIRYVKKHPEIFSNDIYKLGYDSRGNSKNIAEEYRTSNGWARVSTLQRTDPPVHTKYRNLIKEAFSVRRIRLMTNYIETMVNDLLESIQWALDNKDIDLIGMSILSCPNAFGVERDNKLQRYLSRYEVFRRLADIVPMDDRTYKRFHEDLQPPPLPLYHFEAHPLAYADGQTSNFDFASDFALAQSFGFVGLFFSFISSVP